MPSGSGFVHADCAQSPPPPHSALHPAYTANWRSWGSAMASVKFSSSSVAPKQCSPYNSTRCSGCPRPTTSCATARSRTQRKPMPKVKPTCVLSESEGEKPRSALYTCSCGGQFNGLKAWREHMVARSLLHKCKRRRAWAVPFNALKPAAASSPACTPRDAAQPTVHAVAGRPRRCTPFTLLPCAPRA